MRAGAPAPFPILGLVCSILCACAPGGKGEGNDTVADKQQDYPIAGSSARDLRWALDRLGPKNEEGERHDAITKWRFEYTYGFDELRGGCAVGDLDLSAEITTILPRWTADPGTPADLVTRWREYVDCARLHEGGHRRIYLDSLPQFRRRARALGAQRTCDDLSAALDALARAWLEEVKGLQVAYETRTEHGYAQCGYFP